MQRISTLSRLLNKFGVGKDGFKDGDLANGITATNLNADWCNGLQEEVISVIEQAGLTPSNATLNQLMTAIATLQRQQTNTAYTTAGTAPAFTVTLPASAVALAALGTNLRLRLKFHAAGAGSDTLNIAGLGAKSLKQYDSTGAKVAAVIAANQLVDVEYDGVDLVLLDPLPPAATVKQIQPISASVVSNALTLTLNPTNIDFRSSTLTSGAVNTRSVSSAISLTVPSGASLGTIGGQQARLAVLALDNSGTVELAVVNLAGGSPLLDETNLMTTAAMSASATSATTAYSTTARTSLPYRIVGFVDITEAAAGTWVTAPTVVQGQGGQAISALQSLGYGQTWQNVSGSRAYNTTYYNTTGRPISVMVSVVNSAAADTTSSALIVNGLTICTTGEQVNRRSVVNGVIPPGASYSLTYTTNGSACSISSWFELR